MAIQKNLEALRLGHSAIDSVSYVDLGSGTVLAASSTVDLPQERFDAIAALATRLLDGAEGDATEAIRLEPTEAVIVARAAPRSEEVVCLVCAPDADVLSLLDHANATLAAASG